MVDRPCVPGVAELQGDLVGDADELVPLLLSERADHILLKCVRLRVLRAECFGLWYLNRTCPNGEVSQVLKFWPAQNFSSRRPRIRGEES